LLINFLALGISSRIVVSFLTVTVTRLLILLSLVCLPQLYSVAVTKMPHVDETPMAVGDHPQCDPIKTRIIHVGMGASGMLAAHKAKRMLTNYELVCYEKNPTPGGTWVSVKSISGRDSMLIAL